MRKRREVCDGCDEEIDPRLCWCGEEFEGHSSHDHTPVPLGCRCYRGDEEERTVPVDEFLSRRL